MLVKYKIKLSFFFLKFVDAVGYDIFLNLLIVNIFMVIPGYQVSDVLWACLNMFSSSTYTLASKTLLIFPWNDNPHGGKLFVYSFHWFLLLI